MDNLIPANTEFYSYLQLPSNVILITPSPLAFILEFKAPHFLSDSSQCHGSIMGQFPFHVCAIIYMCSIWSLA